MEQLIEEHKRFAKMIGKMGKMGKVLPHPNNHHVCP